MNCSLDINLFGDKVEEDTLYLFLLFFVQNIVERKCYVDTLDCFVQKTEDIIYNYERAIISNWTLPSGKKINYAFSEEHGVGFVAFIDNQMILRASCACSLGEIRNNGVRMMSFVVEVFSEAKELLDLHEIRHIRSLI